MQVVVVDDEPRVLAGIERTLMMSGRDWGLRFATSGQEALEMLEAQPADVVISDMRMPFMDGAELLVRVRERWPGTIRIILTGYSEMDATMRMLDVAHQFVAKPCDSKALLDAVENAIGLRALFADPQVVDVVGRISRLPASPKVFTRLCELMADPETDLRRIADLLGSDPALSAKLLQLANSAYFARGSAIHDVGQAIARLGLDNVRLLVLAAQVFATGDGDGHIDALQHRALLASQLAAHIGGIKGPAPTAALLAHVALSIPEIADPEVRDEVTACATPLHAAVGAYLLAVWGLPMEIVNAVAWHEDPARSSPTHFDTAGVVHVATRLANGREPDLAYLERVGVGAKWPQWQAWMQSTNEDISDD
ncbi:HDOD domain-containing protein [Nitrogeniibacter mangrovi]|uniref:HDOD domain-containing protein n=1 Tax=Nitrogeniibacter mangrovi TaxID=2016596 RepID=A0A6C1B643_9RHOO|nr:HDOD domain-containing protein [Nitrogeniibacter mangrovi]QID18927.1 HDOD domain-containing protein [Nitrogeniibacter mangrovi]